MRKYLLKNSAFNFLLIIAMGSCSVPLYKGLEPAPLPDNAGSFAWFSADTGRYLFKADISIYGNELSGLLFIKPVDESRRALFITETGIKIFDMEFIRGGGYSVVYIAGYMDRKPVIKTIGTALSPMIFNIGPESVKAYKDKSTGKTIISSADSNGKKSCTISETSGKVEELVQEKVFSPELRIRFHSTLPDKPESIDITGLRNRLNINLTTINEN